MAEVCNSSRYKGFWMLNQESVQLIPQATVSESTFIHHQFSPCIFVLGIIKFDHPLCLSAMAFVEKKELKIKGEAKEKGGYACAHRTLQFYSYWPFALCPAYSEIQERYYSILGTPSSLLYLLSISNSRKFDRYLFEIHRSRDISRQDPYQASGRLCQLTLPHFFQSRREITIIHPENWDVHLLWGRGRV